MRIEILTLFPEIFSGFLGASLIEKSIQRALLSVRLSNIRDFTPAPHHRADDTPYGGGAGMVMKPEPLFDATQAAKQRLPNARVILFSASGTPFSQAKAQELSARDELIVVCGRYEGVDQRYIDFCVDEEISIGDYVLMGGEVPAMVLIEACIRLRDNVLHNPASIVEESFSDQSGATLLEAPHYTRPPEFKGKVVPEVLQSGNHANILRWKKEQSLERTRRIRPDLLEKP